MPIATDAPQQLFIRLAATAPTFMVLACRWRSRPQHHKQTSATLRLFSYGKFEFQLKESERCLSCGPNGWSAMLRIIARKHDFLRMLGPRQRPPYSEVWHLWTIILPRRSITGRLLWGTVLRRRDDGRWIYKKYIEGVDPTEYRRSVHKLIVESRKTASISPNSDHVF